MLLLKYKKYSKKRKNFSIYNIISSDVYNTPNFGQTTLLITIVLFAFNNVSNSYIEIESGVWSIREGWKECLEWKQDQPGPYKKIPP